MRNSCVVLEQHKRFPAKIFSPIYFEQGTSLRNPNIGRCNGLFQFQIPAARKKLMGGSAAFGGGSPRRGPACAPYRVPPTGGPTAAAGWRSGAGSAVDATSGWRRAQGARSYAVPPGDTRSYAVLGVLLPAGERTPDTLKGCRSRCPGGVSTRTPPRTARAGVAGADRCPGRVRRRGGHLGARREGGKRRAPASAGSAPNLWGRAPQPTPHASHGGAAPPWGASAPFTRRPHWRRTTAIPPSKRMGAMGGIVLC